MADGADRTGPASAEVRCEAPVVAINGTRIVLLPQEVSAALPSRGQVAVTGRIGGRPLRTVVEPDGRRGHWIRLEHGTDVQHGEVVSLELAVAAEWPEPELPGDLRSALDDAPDLDDMWRSITPMARWEWVRWISATRNPATRARRVEATISKMRAGTRRPCCFDLSACTDPDLARSGKLIAPGE